MAESLWEKVTYRSFDRFQITAKIALLCNNPVFVIVCILHIDHSTNHLGQNRIISFQMFFFKVQIPVQIFIMLQEDWLEN